jgi:hypothetical protein
VALGALSLILSACVQTRQIADLQFTPPRATINCCDAPDVTVGSVKAGGSPSRAPTGPSGARKPHHALEAQQAGRGGQTMILDRRDALPVPADTSPS